MLGIETSWRVGSVAVAIDGTVAARRFLTTPSEHASGLIPAVRRVLHEAAAGLDELTGIVVGAGPGSFTGVRIGGAAAKGLATSLDVPLYATSSLRAACCAEEVVGTGAGLPPELRDEGDPPGRAAKPRDLAGDEREHRYVLLDARHGRVYGASYDVGADGPVEVTAPHGGTVVEVINARPSRGVVFVGEGARAYRTLLRAAGYGTRPYPAGVPLADAVLSYCSWDPVDASAWEPEYVRRWRPG